MPKHSPSPARGIILDLAGLPALSVDELRALWKRYLGRTVPPTQKWLLLRELAWRTQAKQNGGYNARTQRLLQKAMTTARRATEMSKVPSEQGAARRRRAGTCALVRAKANRLVAGTRLVRTWRGVQHEVAVLEGGRSFYCRERTYRSLTAIAEEITGAVCSGPRFFGLTLRKRHERNDTQETDA